MLKKLEESAWLKHLAEWMLAFGIALVITTIALSCIVAVGAVLVFLFHLIA